MDNTVEKLNNISLVKSSLITMKYIDLFAGVGGFHYGIDRAFSNQQTAPIVKIGQRGNRIISKKWADVHDRPEAPLCVYSNEWDKYANSVYRKHFGECDNRDIRTVRAEEIPDHDLLCGGFPCQSFSIAGKRGGFDDTRGTLFFEIARILREKQPRLLLLENVKGLLSHDSGRTFATILFSLDELGYDAQWQVLNSKNFGVPQNRERVFIVGHLRGTSRPQVFPITSYNAKTLGEITSGVSDAQRVYTTEQAKTLKGLGGGMGAKTGLYAVPVLTPNRLKKRQMGRRFKTNGEPAFTLNTQDQHGVMLNRQDGVKKEVDTAGTLSSSDWRGLNRNQDQTGVMKDMAIRRLTPIECERLQGFPDNFTKYGHDGKEMSDTQRYKMLGNAVTTNVVTEIVRGLTVG